MIMAKNVLTEKFSEPLDGTRTAKVNVHVGDGNLVIDRLDANEQVLASGTLQYMEKQGLPAHVLTVNNSLSILSLKAGRGGQPWFRFPWAACNGATEWQIHLNPAVPSDIAAHSNGGNVELNLSGMLITGLSAETGGGNMDVILPDNAANLNASAMTGGGNVAIEIGSGTTGSNMVTAKSGAGNVVLTIPNDVAARIYATTGLGKVILDPRFDKIGDNTYQSSDFDVAANKVEMTLQSGAGNVSVNTK
jgi:hypothetical protein